MSENTSITLLDRLCSGNDEADWRLFVELYQPFVRRQLQARQIPTRDLDDLYQEAMVQVCRGIRSFDHNGRVGAFRKWLKTIVSQRVWRYMRAKQQNGTSLFTEVDDLCPVDDEFDAVWDREHDAFLVNRILDVVRQEFTATTWEAFDRQVLREQSPRHVAEHLCLSVNAVLIAKSRVMRRLREIGQGLVDVDTICE
ncbi:MAG: sigma-70 family RNA polymerase sigma factor [Pirellulales bacterium]